MKNIIIITVLLSTGLMSCKKDISKRIDICKYTYTDDNITATEIAANFMASVDGGSFTIGANGFQGGVNGENVNNKAKRSSVKIGERIFKPAENAIWLGGYYVPDYLSNTTAEVNELYSFFNNIANQTTTNFLLSDTLGQPLIKFIVHNPKPITLTIENQNFRDAPSGSRIILHWNTDSENKLGLAVALSGDNGLRYLQTDESGSLDITEEALQVAGHDRISVTLTRGVILIGKGADGRDYKLTNRVGKTEIVYI